MSERYVKVFELSKNLYTENSPVIILAGALLKDNINDTVITQLKIKNISDKTIKAVKVSIASYDTVGNRIADDLIFDYLDINAQRNDDFGQKTPIVLKENITRSFSVKVDEVIFDDNSIWHDKGKKWESLANGEEIKSIFNDSEIAKQYSIEYGALAKFQLVIEKDLWICACGQINHNNEEHCTHCNISLTDLKNIDFDELKVKAQKRIDAEKKTAASNRKNVIIAIAIFAFFATSLIFYSSYSTKNKQYKLGVSYLNASSMTEDDYDEAIQTFESLGNFKDSKEKISETKYTYALCLSKSEKFEEAIKLFTELNDYKDSQDKIKETKYKYGLNILGEGDFIEATELFVSLGDYENSKQYVELANAMIYLTEPYDVPDGYYTNDKYKALHTYRDHNIDNFKKAKACIEEFEGEMMKELSDLYNQIAIALEYARDWQVVSGDTTIAFDTSLAEFYTDIKKVSIAIKYENSKIKIYFLPQVPNTEDLYYLWGCTFDCVNNDKEPFECNKENKNKCRLSSIEKNKIVVNEYDSNNKVIGTLTLKKAS